MITICINFELSTEWIWMNIKDHFCLSRHLLSAIALNSTQQNWKCLHIRNHQYTHLKFLESSVPWEKTSNFFSPLGFDLQANSDHKTQIIALYSVRALKRCMNEKNLIHDRVMATISKFSPQMFQNLVHRFFKHTLVHLDLGKCHDITHLKGVLQFR